jgi:Ca-activated chloride channel family protein
VGLLSPATLGLSALLGLVLALHMLRPRQAARRVPSLFLWREIRQDPPAARPWKPLRRSPLLLLQLLALSLLVLALSRPWLTSRQAVSGEHLIILVDRSATMAATDLAPNRLAAARRRILALVEGRPGARFTLIAFDAHPELLVAGETDPGRIRRVLEGLTVRPVPGRASEALDFAATLALGQPGTAVILYSDGAFDLDGPPPAGLSLRFDPLGEASVNQAISALSLTEGPADQGPFLFAQAGNGGRRSARRRLLVEVDGRLLDARDLDLPPGGFAGFTLELPPETSRVRVAFDQPDDLPLDDEAWVVRPRSRPLRLALVGEGNRFLEIALGLLPAVASVRYLDAAEAEQPWGPIDLAVLDGLLPARLPDCPLLLVAPRGPLALGSPDALRPTGRVLELPQPVIADPAHPLLAGTGFAEAAILRAQALALGPRWTPLVTTQADGVTWPLVAEGHLNGQRALLMAFDLRDSDLPLLPAFPLFIAAAVENLTPRGLVELPREAALGEPLALRLAPGVQAARVIDPAGEETALSITSGQALFAGTGQAGLYRVLATGPDGLEETAFAVNMVSARPLDIRPRDPLAAAGAGATSAPISPPSPGRRELWRPLAAMAFVLLLAEWAYDHRRALIERLGPPLRRWSTAARRAALPGRG